MISSPDQPLGDPVAWSAAAAPSQRTLAASRVLLRPLDPARDAGELYAASHPPAGDPSIWTYLFDGPFPTVSHLEARYERACADHNAAYLTIVRRSDERILGCAAYLNIRPEVGVIELGDIWFARELQRTSGATEAIHLLARHAFEDLGYRRLEWKCNSLNQPSRQAAERFGFSFEGVFRQHLIVKGRNRDTAWFAITDGDWPSIGEDMVAWLAPENFDQQGRQLTRLREAGRNGSR